jgi:hypothetical protein
MPLGSETTLKPNQRPTGVPATYRNPKLTFCGVYLVCTARDASIDIHRYFRCFHITSRVWIHTYTLIAITNFVFSSATTGWVSGEIVATSAKKSSSKSMENPRVGELRWRLNRS